MRVMWARALIVLSAEGEQVKQVSDWLLGITSADREYRAGPHCLLPGPGYGRGALCPEPDPGGGECVLPMVQFA